MLKFGPWLRIKACSSCQPYNLFSLPVLGVTALSQTLLESSYLPARKNLEAEHQLHLPAAKEVSPTAVLTNLAQSPI